MLKNKVLILAFQIVLSFFFVMFLCLTIYAVIHVKPWAMARIKKEISHALNVKTVNIKDLLIPVNGPIILMGLEIKKSGNFEIKVPQVTLDKGLWTLVEGSTGTAQIQSVEFGKLKITAIKVSFWWKGKDLIINVEEGIFLNGHIKAEAIVRLEKLPVYNITLNMFDLSIPQLVSDFKLKEKFTMTGRMSGKIIVKGRAKTFEYIDGSLHGIEKEGELTIQDDQFVERMAMASGMAKYPEMKNLVVASLKHHKYNKSDIKVSLVKDDLVFYAVLEGESGKRIFPIAIHQFSLERLGL